MPGPGDLYAAAQALLAAAVTGVEQNTLAAVPSYQAIWLGLPSFDCPEAIHVYCGGSAFGDTYPLQPPLQPMERIVTTGLVPLVQMTICVTRCVPVPQGTTGQSQRLPTPASISAAAAIGYADLWAVWHELIQQHRNGTLFQSPSKRTEFILDPAFPVKTSGGVGGWDIPVRFHLPGYYGLGA